MLLDITIDSALKRIEQPRLILEENVVPKSFSPVPHSPYRPGYDWLFTYERRLARLLEPWLKKFRLDLIGDRGVLSEALSNAYCHGHRKDPALPIAIRIYLGKAGLVIQMTDRGKGFNIRRVMRNYQKAKGYFHQAGNGFKLMATSRVFGVFYNRLGNEFNCLYLFSKTFDTLSC